jgi:hypothetical protein
LEPLQASRVFGNGKEGVRVEVFIEGDERFLLKVYADGTEERQLIVKLPRKRRVRRIDWSRKLSTGLKRGFSWINSGSF